ncbi:MAG: ABC-F family ATP-binding cassette domain-containing protein [Christensenellaceae bacterium]|nr:ABC-F family ATP-binding cassette domain-containing protein [Christensenellaceae bacterium]
MIILSVQDIVKSFGIDEILKGITFSLQNGEKMGLVGVNGSGKTTLMKIIAGESNSDSGQVHKNKDLKIGYLAQTDDIDENLSIYEAMLQLFEDTIAKEKRIKEVEKELTHAKSDEEAIRLTNLYHRLNEEFMAIEGYAYEGEIKGVLSGLGFNEEYYPRLVKTLSGGEKTRLSLAKLLLQKPELLLMDEPTNHLDLEALAWLEEYLIQYKGAIMLISHDRYFLDRVCNSIGEILNGKLMKFTGNYTEYQKKRTIDFDARVKAFTLQQKQIEREKAIIERYRSFNREKSIRAAESRQKRLEKIELLERPDEEKQINFKFEARVRTGEEVLKVHELSKSYDDNVLFENLNFKLRAGDRVALIGSNGIGKSTLFKIIMRMEEADAGYTAFGANVDPGYYDQHHRSLHKNKTILDEVWDRFPKLNQSQVRGALGLFLFTGDDVFKPISQLSGGERGRVALTNLMLKQNNFLLLDEPTNHLDADSREVLEDALSDFNGTIIAISHDRYFINKFATKIMLMENKGITEYLGNYDDYIEKKNRPVEPIAEIDGISKTELQKIKRRDRASKQKLKDLKAEFASIEKAIMESENKCRELEKLLADPDTYKDNEKAADLHKEYLAEQDRQHEMYDEMAEIEELLAEFE